MNSYELSRAFVDFSFENPSKIKPNHYALYFFSIEHCNRLGWKKEFGLPTTMAMEAIGIKSYNTYINTFNDLEKFGFFKIIERSKNQYSSNIIALLKNDKAHDKALDKAFIKHVTKHCRSTHQSIDSINKQINNKQINNISSVAKATKHHAIDFDKLLGFINLKTKRSFRIINDKVKKKYKARLKEGYTSKDIANAIENACNSQNHKENNYQYLTPEFFSRADILDKYGASTEKDIKKEKSNRTVENPYETIYGNK